jgi:hypothetical protein
LSEEKLDRVLEGKECDQMKLLVEAQPFETDFSSFAYRKQGVPLSPTAYGLSNKITQNAHVESG